MKAKTGEFMPNIFDWGLRDKKYLLFVGALRKNEGVHYLIEAFKQLEDTAKTPNNFKLVIVAEGDEKDDADYVDYLRLLSHGRSNIMFFCVREKGYIRQLMSHAYLYVGPSEVGQGEEILLEVTELGLAPLVSNMEGNKKIVGENSFFFTAKSVEDLKGRLAYLLNRREEVKNMGKRAQKSFKKIENLKKDEEEKMRQQEKIIFENNKWPWNWKNLLKKCQ